MMSMYGGKCAALWFLSYFAMSLILAIFVISKVIFSLLWKSFSNFFHLLWIKKEILLHSLHISLINLRIYEDWDFPLVQINIQSIYQTNSDHNLLHSFFNKSHFRGLHIHLLVCIHFLFSIIQIFYDLFIIESARVNRITRIRGFETASIGVFLTAMKMAATFYRKYRKVLKQQVIMGQRRMIKLNILKGMVKRMRLGHVDLNFNKKKNKKVWKEKLKDSKTKEKWHEILGCRTALESWRWWMDPPIKALTRGIPTRE